jgi:methyl-accepting chemotaxis protein
MKSRKFKGLKKNSIKNFLIHIFRTIKIKNRLYVAFIFVLMIPMLLIGFTSYSKSSAALTNSTNDALAQYANMLSANISLELDSIEKSVDAILFSDVVQEFIDDRVYSELDDYGALQLEKNISNNVSSQFVNNEYVFDCYLIKNNLGSIVYNYDQHDRFPANMYEDLLKELMARNPAGEWNIVTAELEGVEQQALIYSRVMVNRSTGDVEGVIFVVVSEEDIKRLYNEKSGDISVRVINDGNTIISSADNSEPGQKFLENLSIGTPSTEDQYIDDVELNGERVMLVSHKIEDMNWSIVTSAPMAYIKSAPNQIARIIVIICLISTVFALLVSILITQSITKPLDQMALYMEKAKEGTLTTQTMDNYKDEVGLALTNYVQMSTKINDIVSNVSNNTSMVYCNAAEVNMIADTTLISSNEIRAAVENVATSTMEQTNLVKDGLNSMYTLSAEINCVESDIRKVANSTNITAETGEKSLVHMQQLQKESDENLQITHDINQEMVELQEYMKKIKDIVKIISAVSEQSSLLALNAAIEAARAGSAGRGFAVVASEISKLASNSKDSAERIFNVIGDINSLADRIAIMTVKAGKTADKQAAIIQDVDDVLQNIISLMQETNQYITTTDQSLEKVINVKIETSNKLEEIQGISENTAAAVQEILANTEQQTDSVNKLFRLTKNLDQTVYILENEMKFFHLEDIKQGIQE